ncbi:YdeI/OmpD-associated family protein [Protaetiibacter mangrovi]|uniref:YdeI/OmpD-associated family protein n=1 Tax=Protaetiibacter mangrovi TaxID=2970926 RepID=A0ABT1ZDH8_9MICO|nr:YdeI/OmpD-associated family protein [Protaetiibacter mangrovi]MCS0498743.1 YdeI/OmpD-associated family protein [Protaetiibacter mangrovi]TPX03422.1 bacteriocin-protection protein, YdeI/OmpD-associated family [Schumannella luteola]
MSSFAEKPILPFTDWREWEAFLADDPPAEGVRVKILKKNASVPGITRQEALDVALCFGWIDGQAGAFDADYSLQAYTPRRSRSPWSQINREHVERLIAEGRMRPGGQAEIDRAKADGRWDAAYRQKDAPVPAELQAALDASPAASAFFATVSAQNRWAFIFRIQQAVRPETRERRAREFVAMMERGETPY